MKAFTIRELMHAVRGRYFGDPGQLDTEIVSVVSDSRAAGEGALFVALRGTRVDGHRFMAQCLKNGAVCCLSEKEPSAAEEPCVQVEDTYRAIGELAAWHRGRFAIPVIGVTGSVGKTTTKEMIASVLSVRYQTHKTSKNLNNELGVPQTLLRLDDRDQISVVEMGISGFGEMRRLTRMVRPTIAVITVIGDAHLEFLGDRQGVLRAKGEIFESMGPEGLAVLNGDDLLLKDYEPGLPVIRYGLGPGNDFYATEVQCTAEGQLACRIHHHGRSFEACVPAFGQHLVYSALAAAAVGWANGMEDAEIAQGLASYQTVGERARLIHTPRYTVISDCYNANPSSDGAALRSLCMLKGRKVCILGDMMELGERSAELHAGVGALAAELKVDKIIACGERARDIYPAASAAGADAVWYPDKQCLLRDLPELLKEGDCVLVKASHSMAFEEITDALERD